MCFKKGQVKPVPSFLMNSLRTSIAKFEAQMELSPERSEWDCESQAKNEQSDV